MLTSIQVLMLSVKRPGIVRGKLTRRMETKMKKRMKRLATKTLSSRLRQLYNLQLPRPSYLAYRRVSIWTAKSRYTERNLRLHRLQAVRKTHWTRSLLQLMLSMLVSTRLANSDQGYRLITRVPMREPSTQHWKLTTSLKRPGGLLRIEPTWQRSSKQLVHQSPRREVSIRRAKTYNQVGIQSCIFL